MSMLIKASEKEDIVKYVKSVVSELQQIPVFCAVFGSWVYGTARTDSDYDVYVVCKPDIDSKNIKSTDITHGAYTETDPISKKIDLMIRSFDEFKKMVSIGDPQAIELVLESSSVSDFILIKSDEMDVYVKSIDFSDKTFRQKIRSGFSEKSSWAEVRAKKKFIDSEIDIALKSAYHSFRILWFGIQIGLYGYIKDWTIANPMLEELKSKPTNELSEQYLKDMIKLWARTKLLNKAEHGIDGTVTTAFKNVLPKI
jgi:predicted nucleotidyltransferase